MRTLTWVLRFALFVLLLAFAAKNTEPVTLRFFFDASWQVPLAALLLGFFVGGAVLGLLAAAGALLRQRRKLARLERAQRAGAGEATPPVPPRPAEG
ncbi:MAG: LapA family protein [Burkholderiales bacterium]|nr:LapA family protein [Burkholderiales bacterium]